MIDYDNRKWWRKKRRTFSMMIPDIKSSSFYNTDCVIDMYAYDKR